MHQYRFVVSAVVIVASLVLAQTDAAADTFFIDPNGSNGNDGSKDNPWGTFSFAIDQLDPGDRLYVRGGMYNLNSRITLSTGDGGSAGNRVEIWAYEENGIMETPILDFSGMTSSWGSTSSRGIQVNNGVDWLHFKGLTIQNARDNGIESQSDNSIFERMTTRWNGDSGLQLDGPSAHNLILNSDSYENYDPSGNGENADGFAIKFSQIGPGNIVRGSRAWGNSDDGWDMWQSTVGAVLVEDSWSWDNGKIIPQFFLKELEELDNMDEDNFGGDGNGFKLGQQGGNHVLNRVLAWENAARGIDSNTNANGVFVYNSTVYDSNRNWDFDEPAGGGVEHYFRNNISFAANPLNPDRFEDPITMTTTVNSAFNSWDGGVTLTAADFLSLDPSIAEGPRNADGTLPISDYLRLAPDSDLVNAGTPISFTFDGVNYTPAYFGPAPDLGAFENTTIFVPPGDADGDGDVDLDDYNIMSGNMNTNVAGGASDGDFDEDGDVDFEDFVIQALNFGDWPSAEETLNVVPEPVVALPLFGMLLLTRRRRVSIPKPR